MWRGTLVCCLVLSIGCGVQSARESARRAAEDADFAHGADAAGAAREAAPAAHAAAAIPKASRKIIYDAEITVVVSDFAVTEQGIARLVRDHGGYLADVAIDRASGERRSGRWVARIPVDRFDTFLEAIADLGVPTSRRQTAQDVTEEYVDLEARIANAKRLEERILELLSQSSGEIKDVIEVERELARVRGEVEQMEGRLKYLANRTEMATVTITAREEHDYVPPQSPTFAGRADTAWSNSLLALKTFAQDLSISAIYAAPWLAVLLVVVLPVAWILRQARRRRRVLSGK
jgi:hypothetical protein